MYRLQRSFGVAVGEGERGSRFFSSVRSWVELCLERPFGLCLRATVRILMKSLSVVLSQAIFRPHFLARLSRRMSLAVFLCHGVLSGCFSAVFLSDSFSVDLFRLCFLVILFRGCPPAVTLSDSFSVDIFRSYFSAILFRWISFGRVSW